MGHNRAADKRKIKKRRRKKELERLFEKTISNRSGRKPVELTVAVPRVYPKMTRWPGIEAVWEHVRFDAAVDRVAVKSNWDTRRMEQEVQRIIKNPYADIGEPTGQFRPECPGCDSDNTFKTSSDGRCWRCDSCYITFNEGSIKKWVPVR